MGLTPLSFSEIAAWANLTGRDLTPWEAALLRRLSRAFVGGYQTEDPPYEPLLTRKLLLSGKLLG